VKIRQIGTGLCALLVMAVAVEAKKRPVQPTQEPIIRGCIVVGNITSQRFGWTSAPGIKAEVYNGCNAAASVGVTAAFFDSQGQRLESDSERQTIAPNNRWLLFIAVPERFCNGWMGCTVKST
jgi:hypothetical protein